jgi:hypothetical protein
VIWATRDFGRGDWFAVRKLFEKQFMALGAHQSMMLVARDLPNNATRLYIGLPDGTLLKSYPGFQEIAEADLPDRAKLLVGDANAFEARFRSDAPDHRRR